MRGVTAGFGWLCWWPGDPREAVSLSAHGRLSVVTESVEKTEQLMIFGVILHVLSGFGGGEGGWMRGGRGSLG